MFLESDETLSDHSKCSIYYISLSEQILWNINTLKWSWNLSDL